jgi:hypothetical protein
MIACASRAARAASPRTSAPTRTRRGGSSTDAPSRSSELEFRIACEGAGISYDRLAIRESLRLLRDFYRARQDEAPDDHRVRMALEDVERRLSIEPVSPARKLDG